MSAPVSVTVDAAAPLPVVAAGDPAAPAGSAEQFAGVITELLPTASPPAADTLAELPVPDADTPMASVPDLPVRDEPSPHKDEDVADAAALMPVDTQAVLALLAPVIPVTPVVAADVPGDAPSPAAPPAATVDAVDAAPPSQGMASQAQPPAPSHATAPAAPAAPAAAAATPRAPAPAPRTAVFPSAAVDSAAENQPAPTGRRIDARIDPGQLPLPPASVPISTAPAVVAPPTAPTRHYAELPDVQPVLGMELARLRSRGDGTHELTVSLHPAELGQVGVTATVRDGTLALTVACADHLAHDAVRAALPTLHHELLQAGFTGIDVALEHRDAQPDPRAAQQAPDRSAPATDERADPSASTAAARVRRPMSDAALDRWL